MITVRKITHSWADLTDHFYAFLIDFCFSALPAYGWMLLFLLSGSGIISIRHFDWFLYITMIGMLLIGVLLLPITTAKNLGQSWGGKQLGMRLIQKNGKKASESKLMRRQAMAVGLPIMVFGYTYNILGIATWFFLNGIVAILSKNQQTIIDHLMGLIWVKESDPTLLSS